MPQCKRVVTIVVVVAFAMLTGCTAINTSIEHRNLDVQTKMSSTIFLNPVPKAQQTVYVQIKNTSDKPNFHVARQVKQALAQKGYHVVGDLAKAHYLLQANILQVGKANPKEALRVLHGGYGGAFDGAAIAVLSTAAMGANGRTGLAAGLVGGLVGTVANAMVKDVTYSVITDVMVSERTTGALVQQQLSSTLKQGSSSVTTQSRQTKTRWQRYQTRVLSTADKVNLAFAEAKPVLATGLSHALAGLF